MSTIGYPQSRGFALERAVIRVGRAMVTWGERREQAQDDRQDLYRRQAAHQESQAARIAAARSQLLP